jgi:hypothetical protein
MKLLPINKIKPNPSNPRVIKDNKFQQLKKSLEDFPDMAKVRPIVVNTDMVVLGGNMRLKAMQAAGWKEVPVEVVDWPEERQREFIIKDNVGFGEWDWEVIANEWPEVGEWGLDVPGWSNGLDVNNMTDDDVDLTEDFDPIGEASGMQRVVFIFDGPNEAESYLNNLGVKFKKMAQAWQVELHTRSI